jgi:hypothetical protein
MSITPTFPGIYIEELSSNSHAITAAPTSVTVFVGYTHPFMTDPANWNQAVQIFNFTDYENGFGGLYTSGVFQSHVAYAVSQFFLNGGATAYVVALPPNYYDSYGDNMGQAWTLNPAVEVGAVTFTGLQPVDIVPMTVTINNLQTVTNPNDTADVTISYGPRAETYRKVTLASSDPVNYIVNRINKVTKLAKVAVSGTSFTAIGHAQLLYPSTVLPIWTTFSVNDFSGVFVQDSSLDKLVALFNLVTIPGVTDNTIWSEALSFCERKLAFVIMDPPVQDTADGYLQNLPTIYSDFQGPLIPKSTNGALYFPYLQCGDPLTGNTFPLPPSGSVAGLYATTDAARGVWKAPAGLQTIVQNTIGCVPTGEMTDMRQGTLNQVGVDCLRDFPGVGTVIWGARTLVTENPAFQQWEYVPVRRMALFIEQTLRANLTWVVFEPNDAILWAAIRASIEGFMLTLFQQNAFPGTTPSQCFQVLCDNTTTTPQDQENGIVNILVAFAPLYPAEFVVIQIAQMAGQTQS